MSSLFDPDAIARPRPRPGRRVTAVTAVALVVLSWSLLGRVAADARDGARPTQSLAFVFGPSHGPLSDTTL